MFTWSKVRRAGPTVQTSALPLLPFDPRQETNIRRVVSKPACLPARLLTSLPAYQPACLRTFPAYRPAAQSLAT